MRTTLTLDDDIAAELMDRAKKLGIPFKQVVNRTLRSGLGEKDASAGETGAVKVIPHDFGAAVPPGYPSDVNFNRLADELEDEEIIAKLQRDVAR